MLEHDDIEDLISWTPENTLGDGYSVFFSDIAKEIGSNSLVDITVFLTKRFMPRWQNFAQILKVENFCKYEIAVVPSSKFCAEVFFHNGKKNIIRASCKTPQNQRLTLPNLA